MKLKHTLNLADAITASCILFTGFVLLCSAFSVQFYVFYLLGAFTDMIDGWVARKLNLKSSFGAKLDTIVGYVFVIAVLAKALLSVHVPEWLWIWIAVIAFMKLTNLVSSFVMFRRMVSMHTAMNKVAGFMLLLRPFGIGRGSWQALAVAAIVTCSAATFAAIHEVHFIRAGKEIA